MNEISCKQSKRDKFYGLINNNRQPYQPELLINHQTVIAQLRETESKTSSYFKGRRIGPFQTESRYMPHGEATRTSSLRRLASRAHLKTFAPFLNMI